MELTLPEMKALFIRLKREESLASPNMPLSGMERGLLFRLEKALYAKLSVQEAENLMREIAAQNV
jgi:hypothetical protein